jgi:hypothetical protein
MENMNTKQEKFVAIGGKIKATKNSNQGIVEGLGVMFSGPETPDLEGDYFSSKTYYGKHAGNGMDATLNHTMPVVTDDLQSNQWLEQLANKRFKNAVETTVVDYGILSKHVLDLADEFEAWVFDMVQQGAFSWSSGAVNHMARSTAVGGAYHIDDWVIGEWAYTPTPAEPRKGHITPLKSLENVALQVAAEPREKVKQNGNGADELETGQPENSEKDNFKMDEKQIQEMVEAAATKAAEAAAEATAKAFAEQRAEQEPPINDDGLNVPNVAKNSDLWKYDHLEPGDHALAISLLNAAAGQKSTRGGDIQPASFSMVKSLAAKLARDNRKTEIGQPLHSRTKAAMVKSFGFADEKKILSATKADELNYSTQSGYGDEWVGVAYGNELWPRVVQDTPVLNRIPTMEIPDGAESVVIPLDGAPPTFYLVAQATDKSANPGHITETVTTSKQATGSQTLTSSKIGAAVDWTGELNEDAVVQFAAELRRNIEQEMREVMEHVAIDGDTATGATTNINDIGGTPGGKEAFLAVNGFRKLALVTNTANSRSGGVLAVEDLLETIKLMGLAGRNAIRKDLVSFISDLWTHWKMLELAELKTRDVFVQPTIENGMLANVYGYQFIPSANMHRANQDATYGLKANSAGKLDLDTASNNTTGSILAVRWDQWRMGFKRRVTFEVERVPRADAYEITALTRFGLINRDAEASAISYNLTL